MLLTSLTVDPAEFAAQTGWESKPEGLCKGDMCVPAPEAITPEGELDMQIVSERLGMSLVEEPSSRMWAIGPESGGTALSTATVPDLELPDIDGNPFSLAALHGRKVLLVAWASW